MSPFQIEMSPFQLKVSLFFPSKKSFLLGIFEVTGVNEEMVLR